MTHSFQAEGREYQLYKRRPDPNAPWYFRLQVRGVDTPRCMNTNLVDVALRQARIMIREARGAKWTDYLDGTRLRAKPTSTLADLAAALRAYAHKRPTATPANSIYVRSLPLFH